MPSGSCAHISELPAEQLELLGSVRRGVLSTVGSDDFPHSVPVVFAIIGDEIVSPIDDKPKKGPELARVRNIGSGSPATLLVDHWDEDWTKLAWVMVRGSARVESGNAADRVLRSRYPQYEEDLTPGSRSIVLIPRRITWWSWE